LLFSCSPQRGAPERCGTEGSGRGYETRIAETTPDRIDMVCVIGNSNQHFAYCARPGAFATWCLMVYAGEVCNAELGKRCELLSFLLINSTHLCDDEEFFCWFSLPTYQTASTVPDSATTDGPPMPIKLINRTAVSGSLSIHLPAIQS
jgi:hypothetical protein